MLGAGERPSLAAEGVHDIQPLGGAGGGITPEGAVVDGDVAIRRDKVTHCQGHVHAIVTRAIGRPDDLEILRICLP